MAFAESWQGFVNRRQLEELEKIIEDEGLDRCAVYAFVKNAFRDGGIITTGTAISKILPSVSRFSKEGNRGKKRKSVFDKLTSFFDKFFDISAGEFNG